MSSSDSFVSIRRPAGFPWCFIQRTTASAKRGRLRCPSGVSFVLTKPVEPEEVLKIVDRVLSGERETETPPDAAPLPTEFDREHLRLLTDKLSEKARDLSTANARLRALINIGLELASETGLGAAASERVRGRARLVWRDLRHARASSIETTGRCSVSSPMERTPQAGSRSVTRSLESSRRSSPSDGRCVATTLAAIRQTSTALAPSDSSGVSGRAHRVTGPCLRLDLSRRE